MKFGSLVIAGIVTGSIYAVFAVCVSVWYRVSNILNLAVGDFAMVGALGVDDLVRIRNWPLPAAIAATLAVVAVFAYAYDQVVLRLAQDGLGRQGGRGRQEGIVITFFFTFALSFFIDGIAKVLFGTDVHAAPALWGGNSLSIVSGLHLQRAGLLVLVCALISGSMFWLYIRYTLGGKAMEACGENRLGARIVGIDVRRYRRVIFVGTAVLAAIFGIVESPITGYTYLSGATISLTGFIAAAYGGFRKPGRAVAAGLAIGVIEALLGGYVSAQYGDTVMYAILAAMVLAWPRALGFESAVSS
jgi:branched-subunit amino acid ABC-type transport system permease component